jgi:hypothetical protein
VKNSFTVFEKTIRMKKTGLTLSCCLLAAFSHAQIFYSNAATQAGIDHTYAGNSGGGVSFFDFDGDGLDDITLATGQGEALHFYKNTGTGFQKLIALVPHIEQAKQVLWVDYDNDGDKDLYVAAFGGVNRLYQNTGDLSFMDVTLAAGLPMTSHITFGACWGDFDRDGWLDLYYGERIPGGVNENRLFKNNSDGTFTDVSLTSGANDAGKIPFCSAFFDYNNDKWPDIYTANDKLSGNTLLENNGNGAFTDVSTVAGAGLIMDAMCVAVGDYDNDGWQDVYISDIENGNEFLHNLGANAGGGQVTFEEVAEETGTGFYGIGWGSNFLDADNDGDLDLYVSGMMVGADVVSSAFYQNDGDGTFSEPPAGFVGDTVSSFNNATGDFNGDGFPDIMVINTIPFKSQLWKNGGGNSHWLKITLEGVLSNRDAIGAKIEVYAGGQYQMRYKHCGIGFMGQNSGTEIVGLGSLTMVDSVVVTWPTGHIDRLYQLPVDQKIFIQEGSTTNGEISVDDDVMLVTGTAGISSTGFEIKILPNPAAASLQIQMPEQIFTRFAIINRMGRVSLTGKIETADFQVDVSNLPAGVYFLTLWNEAGKRAAAKWMKQ